ncbi:MAG: ABC transporter permease subunit [Spirochaetales bacterium]|nr:ABC transporter permease subunit [Leptospiraceae bacterium]MCP5482926.1 ABC transporter permease subunit [Spirochaetales bacterium]MCP5484894.1 ABC transporter permease subunit [Spirochaetales bacterium]
MKTYVIRRLLLMIPTLLGITILVFTLIQFLPGGPVEQYIARVREAAGQTGTDLGRQITTRELDRIRAHFGYDRPAHERYIIWLGNVLVLDLGESFTYQEPAWDVIRARMPISLFFGLTSFLLSYLICIPLGLKKALSHQSTFDVASSTLIFAGYVIPGYVLGLLLIIFLAGGSYLDLFPIGNVVSDNFEELSFGAKILDFLHHMLLPMICYMASEFAFLTLLMKNTLLDELGKDYMRTAMVKGSDFDTAVRRHALRNALIPIATRLSEIFTLIFAGALLIEKVFNIDGMGLLVYNAILDRDYNVVMGIILMVSVLTMFGRLFSDLLYVLIDPRIRFD